MALVHHLVKGLSRLGVPSGRLRELRQAPNGRVDINRIDLNPVPDPPSPMRRHQR